VFCTAADRGADGSVLTLNGNHYNPGDLSSWLSGVFDIDNIKECFNNEGDLLVVAAEQDLN
jgi:hypothetical protein